MIGTHDIQNVTVDPFRPNEIRVRGDFIDQTTATGVLLIVYSLDNDSNVQYITSIRSTDKDTNIDINVTDVSGFEYRVAVFALESGLPFPRVVTSPVIVNTADTENQSIMY